MGRYEFSNGELARRSGEHKLSYYLETLFIGLSIAFEISISIVLE